MKRIPTEFHNFGLILEFGGQAFFVFCIFSVQLISINDHCTCHYNQMYYTNMLICSGVKWTSLPHDVPKHTNTIQIHGGNMSVLCGDYPYLDIGYENAHVTNLNLDANNIVNICDELLETIVTNSTIQQLGLANNSIAKVSAIFNSPRNKLKKIWLGRNPIQCECGMTWLTQWLTKGVVQDYEQVICAKGRNVGSPVYKLDAIEMDCYLTNIPVWFIVMCSVVAGSGILLCISLILINNNKEKIGFIIYDKFGKIVGDPDRNENISDKVFDAFLTYK